MPTCDHVARSGGTKPAGDGHGNRFPRAQRVVVVAPGRPGKFDRTHPGGRCGEQCFGLQPRHMPADALVDAHPEADVRRRVRAEERRRGRRPGSPRRTRRDAQFPQRTRPEDPGQHRAARHARADRPPATALAHPGGGLEILPAGERGTIQVHDRAGVAQFRGRVLLPRHETLRPQQAGPPSGAAFLHRGRQWFRATATDLRARRERGQPGIQVQQAVFVPRPHADPIAMGSRSARKAIDCRARPPWSNRQRTPSRVAWCSIGSSGVVRPVHATRPPGNGKRPRGRRTASTDARSCWQHRIHVRAGGPVR